MSRVCSMEDDGISNACTMKVIMKRPVTSTPASEARNSTVVSRGFSSCSLSFLATRLLVQRFRNSPDQPQRAVPACDLHDMTQCIKEPVKFITGSYWPGRRIGATHRPVDHQRPAHNVLLRYKSPVPAVQAVVAIVPHHKIAALRHD